MLKTGACIAAGNTLIYSSSYCIQGIEIHRGSNKLIYERFLDSVCFPFDNCLSSQ